jgi:4-diphosphocytidyl-2C-methyl-D-erythritol kinase
MVVFPKAKINIGLRIMEKRPDGYHNIETFFYPVDLADALEFVVRKDSRRSDTLKVTGVMEESDPEKNLVMKAVKVMRQSFDFPGIRIHLHKNIPVGAGLGGGSSDAAWMIKALNKYFGFGLNAEEMRSIAGLIGSDAPFFIDGTPHLPRESATFSQSSHWILAGIILSSCTLTQISALWKLTPDVCHAPPVCRSGSFSTCRSVNGAAG